MVDWEKTWEWSNSTHITSETAHILQDSAQTMIDNFLMSKKGFIQKQWEYICKISDAKLLLDIPELQKNLTIDSITYIKGFNWEIGHLNISASASTRKQWDIFNLVSSNFRSDWVNKTPIFSKHHWFHPPYEGITLHFKEKCIMIDIKEK